MPPTIGKAIRLINSEPVPVPKSIGIKPAKMTATVMALGRTRSTAPVRIASLSCCSVKDVVEEDRFCCAC